MSGLDAIVRSIDEEIDRLQRARSLVTGQTAPMKRGMPRSKQSIATLSEVNYKHEAERKKRVVAEHTTRWFKLKEQGSGS
jgi:enterochelin esterase-like enzyme